jgi:hypothetical protein
MFANEVGIETTLNSDVMDSAIYREMFQVLNETLYQTYAEDIAEALKAESEPEIVSADTASWRGDAKQRSPLALAIAKEFDLNPRSLKSFLYYSVLLGVSTRSERLTCFDDDDFFFNFFFSPFIYFIII